MVVFPNIISQVINLFYPRLCAACDEALLQGENEICLSCMHKLPYTYFHLHEDNPVARQFWGRLPLERAAAMLYFSPRSKVQHLIHQFKYRGRPNVGVVLGRKYGEEIRHHPGFATVDLVIPVPLHENKERKRGYNQSAMLAKGMAEGMGIPYNTTILLRIQESETQTRKTRFRRWENVREKFLLTDPALIENKHVLVVDDVITTGATLEAACQPLLQVKGLKLSIAALAFPDD